MSWNEEIKKELGYCGEQVFIGHNVIFTNPKGVRLADRVRIDPFTLITTNFITGSNVHICSHSVLGGGSQQTIKFGNWSFVGYGSYLFTASEDYSGEHGPVLDFWGSNEIRRGDITFEDYAGVASQVMVMPGVTLQEGTAIGAQSFVYRSPELPWAVYAGKPLAFRMLRNKENVLEKANDPNFLKQRHNIEASFFDFYHQHMNSK